MSDSSDFEFGSLVFVVDDFFELVNDPFLKTNKGTGHSRPHYFAIQDKFESDIFWVVPLSSKIQKFDRIVDRKIQANRPHDGLKKVKIRNREGYLLFQDMFPTKKEYLTEYKQSGKTVQLKENNDLNELTKQAYAVVGLLMKGVKFNKTQPNVKRILGKLSEDNKIQKELSQFMDDNPELKPERAYRSKTNDRGL